MPMPDAVPALGPAGPFPRAQLGDHLERRWLHYAFRSPDGRLSMIANLSSLGTSGGPGERPQGMSVLLLHEQGRGWRSTQFTAAVDGEPWSAFRLPQPGPRLRVAGRSGTPAADLRLARTGRACTSQCAPFATDQHLRWQSEPGVVAHGSLRLDDVVHHDVHMVGYHERVRGRWGWPELGGWVFGFANDHAEPGSPPAHSVVFTLIQPPVPADATAGSVMLWRRGRLLRHFPRRRVDVAVVGLLGRDDVETVPPLAAALGTPSATPVPARLVITASMGEDRLLFDVNADTAGRIVNPSETSLLPFGVHEVLGPCRVSGSVAGREVAFTAGAVVEFAGGAHAD
jgi:hypothetical protein